MDKYDHQSGKPGTGDAGVQYGGVADVKEMFARTIAFIWLFWYWTTTQAQEGSDLKFRYWAIAYCNDTQQPIEGILIILTGKDGHLDSLYTDTIGIARTTTGIDTLELHPENDYRIDIVWPNGPVRLRDRVVTDTLQESTTFVKEYFLWDCNDPSTDDRWLPPSIYFASNSALPRTDSSWYQMEAQVNSIEEAIDAIVEMMEDNPTLIISVIGSCDVREKNSEQLALARANRVRNLLIEQGIPSARLEAEGRAEGHRYGKNEIANIKDRRERENALARDRQVGYLVVSFDYKP